MRPDSSRSRMRNGLSKPVSRSSKACGVKLSPFNSPFSSMEIKKLPPARRRAIGAKSRDWVKFEFLQPGRLLPPVIRPAVDGIDLTAWAAMEGETIETQLMKYGGILFRGFNLGSATGFEHFIEATSNQ